MEAGKYQALRQTSVAQKGVADLLGETFANFAVHRFWVEPVEMPAHCITGDSVIIHLSSPVSVYWLHEKRHHTTHIPTGGVSLHGAGELPAFQLTERAELLEIVLAPHFVEQAFHHKENAPVRLQNAYGIDDPQIHHLGMALHADCVAGSPSGKLFGDCLALALTSRLFSCYQTDSSAFLLPPPPLPHGFSDRTQRLITDYISDHLADDVTLSALASVSAYSTHHFTLLFKRTFGVSPHQYVLRARVEKARGLLISSSLSLAEISFCVGFANQSHFSLHFKRLVGETPRKYRESVKAIKIGRSY